MLSESLDLCCLTGALVLNLPAKLNQNISYLLAIIAFTFDALIIKAFALSLSLV